MTFVKIYTKNGQKLAKQIKHFYSEIKVLHISGYTDDAIGCHDVLDPDVAFLQKPFKANDLMQKVYEYCTELYKNVSMFEKKEKNRLLCIWPCLRQA